MFFKAFEIWVTCVYRDVISVESKKHAGNTAKTSIKKASKRKAKMTKEATARRKEGKNRGTNHNDKDAQNKEV